MSLDRLQQAWKAESSQGKVTFDLDQLSREVQQSHDAFRSTIFWRDVREVGAALVLIPIWIVMGIGSSSPWTWYLAIPAYLWIAGFILVDRRRHPQLPNDPSEPLAVNLRKSLAQVEHQIWLLLNVFWWYLLPCCIAAAAYFIHVGWNTTGRWWGAILTSLIPGVFVYFVYFCVYRLNRTAVKKQLEPRRNDLQRLIDQLESDSPPVEPDHLIDLASALSGSDGSAGLSPNWASWAETWNRTIPSWRVAAMILVPTLLGAYFGWLFAFPNFGPVFFQSVVAAVIPFVIALFGRMYVTHQRYKDTPPAGKGPSQPNAPAISIIVLTVVMGILAVAAVISFVTFAGKRGPGLEDISAFNDGDIAHIDDWLQRLQDSTYPSLSAAVVRDGEIVYQGAVGVEDTETNRAATSRTQYHVASVTKVFTTSLAVMLYEQGLIDLDQTVVTYLPADVRISTTPERGATITLRQLASHTSGLPRGVPGQVQSVEGRYELEPERLYDLLAKVELISDPGMAEEYSNLGFGLLGHVLERAANKSLDQLLQEMICGPLKLEGTGIEGNRHLHPATGYARESLGGAKTKHSLKERLSGSGGLVTTTEDLGRFLMAQMKTGVFTAEMLQELHTETKLADGIPSGTALGWSISSTEGADRVLEKNGGRSNCSAWIGFCPAHNVGVAVVTNSGGPSVDPLGRKLLDQSIPLAEKKLVSEYGYAKVAPYTGVRWEGDQPIVRINEQWSPLVSIDGITIDRLMKFANEEFGSVARKRFAEDLVEVLSKYGHEPGWTVTLVLKKGNGSIDERQVLMTKTNRDRARYEGRQQ
ncbi:MAG: serine hydrolase domain-containing protein [Pirellulaceae bacterium]